MGYKLQLYCCFGDWAKLHGGWVVDFAISSRHTRNRIMMWLWMGWLDDHIWHVCFHYSTAAS